MVHISFFRLFGNAINGLRVPHRSQGSNRHNLSLSSFKQPGTVCSRQNTCIHPDRPDFIQFSVIRTYPLIQNHAPHLFFCDIIKNTVHIFSVFRIDFFKMFLGFRFNRIHIIQTFHLVVSLDRGPHLTFRVISDCGVDFFRNFVEFNFLFRLADFSHNILNKGHELFNFLMSKHDSVQYILFRNFIGTGFYHHDCFLCTGNYKMHIAGFPLLQTGVYNKLAIHSSDQNRTCGAIPWNIRNRKGDRRSDHSRDLRRRVIINTHNGSDYLYIIIKSLWKQRSQRSVHQS